MISKVMGFSIPRTRVMDEIAPPGTTPKPLTLLRAPFGYGKSTLLQHWSRGAVKGGLDTLTISIPMGSTPAAFWALLADAVPGLGDGAGDTSTSYEKVQSWTKSLTEPMVLILDEYHHVSSSSVDQKLAELLVQAPNLHLIVAANEFATLDGPLTTTRISTKMLGAEVLRLTPDEVGQVLTLYDIDHLERVKLRVDQVNGWPLGLELIIQGHSHRITAGELSIDALRSMYSLAVEENAQKILSLVAVFPGATTGFLAQSLPEKPAQVELALSALLAAGLIEVERSASPPRYSCIPYMRAFLKESANEFWSAEELTVLRQGHAHSIAAREPVEALRLFFEVEDYDDAEDLLLLRLVKFTGNLPEVLRLLRGVSAKVRAEHPVITGIRLLFEIMGGGDVITAADVLTEELRSAMTESLEQGTFKNLLAAQSFLVLAERRSGNWDEALALAKDLDDRLDRNATAYSEDSSGVVLLARNVIGQTALLSGDLQLARQSGRKMAEYLSGVGPSFALADAYLQQALVSATSGDSVEAQHLVDRAQNVMGALGGKLPAFVEKQAALVGSVISDRRGDAFQKKSAISVVDPSHFYSDYWPIYVLLESSLVRQEEGPYPAFRLLTARIESLRASALVAPLYRERMLVALADLSIYMGRYELAEELLEATDEDNPYRVNSWARLHLYGQNYQQALALLEGAEDPERLGHGLNDRILLRALTLFAAGDETGALSWFERYAEATEADVTRIDLTRVPYSLLLSLTRLAESAGTCNLLPDVMGILPVYRTDSVEKLSGAEMRILSLINEGLSISEIAESVMPHVNMPAK